MSRSRVLAAHLGGYTTSYVLRRITDEAARSLRTGENTITIHCRQTGGGQYIEMCLVEVIEQR